MNLKSALRCGAAAVLLAGSGAHAATINLVDLGGVTGSQAERGFNIAAAFWSNILTNTATINLGVSFDKLDPGVIGSTGSRTVNYQVQDWKNRVNATKSSSVLDQGLVLPTLTNGTIDYITSGVDATGGNTADPAAQVFATDSYAGFMLYTNSAVVKAIGGALDSPEGLDGEVTFSSNFSFDFNPTDGIETNHMDFIGVAIHEIGHALGFVSGVDYLDYYGSPNGLGGSLGYDLNNTSIFTALDMFRYSNDPNNLAPGSGPVLDMTPGTASYFSIDGGTTALFGNSFSTGSFNGDGRQASHWKDAVGCSGQLGVMDPTFCYAQMGDVTALDLAAFDAMGWNLSRDVLLNPGFHRTSAQIYAAFVPEPASWAMMLGGFGVIGAVLRRRRTTIAFG